MITPKRKIIISVHGIKTHGLWQKNIASVVSENGWIYYPLDYGYFSASQFLVPPLRRRKIKWFCDEFDRIKERFEDVIPSVICHSNGSYIVANALKTYPHIKIDKLILCGSIVRRDFDWKAIFDGKQATLVRNEIGQKDIWSRLVKCFAWFDTGASGRKGFKQINPRLKQPNFTEFSHSSFQALGHYRNNWLPFLDTPMPYEGETDPPWLSEEPVSPLDAARWSAMTYFHQYISRMADAISHGEIFQEDKATVLNPKTIRVIIPKTPGAASKDAVKLFYRKNGLKTGHAGINDSRSFQYKGGEVLYDIPSTLNTLGFLDHRKDAELIEAVAEFKKWLERLTESPRSNCADLIQIIEMDKISQNLD